MKPKILIATSNPHKQQKLKEIVRGFFKPIILTLPKIQEKGKTFQEVAEHKAKKFSKWFNGWAVATDAGSRIPALKNWNALKTRRFTTGDDFRRMKLLLKMMRNKKNRTVYWDEALAVAYKGKIIFAVTASAMPAKLQKFYDPKKYEKGHWLDSLCSFPQFGNKNFFDLTPTQRRKAEDSWTKLKREFINFFKKYPPS
ncbi:MAG: non-canonical purine NTP pyrophosphatase [Patescibacteria group bacterium]